MQIHNPTAFVVFGFLQVALPVTAWTILHRRHDPRGLAMWCIGTLVYGVACLLIGVRDTTPPWLAFALASSLFAAWGLLIQALSHELRLPAPAMRTVGMWMLVTALFVLLREADVTVGLRLAYTWGVCAAAASAVALLAYRLYRTTGFRSAALLAGAYALFAAAAWLRTGHVAWHWREIQVLTPHWTFALAFVTSLVATLYGNLGYIGLAMESTQMREMSRRVELAREHEMRLQAELRVDEQAQLLEERSRLLRQREEILGALSHEVRQPLNNASAALQSAEAAMMNGGTEPEPQALVRVRRASDVLARVAASVDNTLTDAVLLTGADPVARQDVETEMLVRLVLGDLPPGSRKRVVVNRITTTRTATMHPGLMRIALRNLLANALAYSPAGSPVTVRISDSEEPLALVIEVEDQGSGVDPDLLPRLFTRGARGETARNDHGHGLGLYIVRRVMELHQGTVALTRNDASGSCFRLTIPQDTWP
ncbi:MAG: HAMP domain-containing histidine kinase [Rubrivivax sp.]|nr:MAG: HAMP domain-containing histidine kinase [Rubrivivax sp.]